MSKGRSPIWCGTGPVWPGAVPDMAPDSIFHSLIPHLTRGSTESCTGESYSFSSDDDSPHLIHCSSSAHLVRGYRVLVFHSRSRAMICGTRDPAIHFRFRATFGRSLRFRAIIRRFSTVLWRYCARERLECPNCARECRMRPKAARQCRVCPNIARQHRACPEVARERRVFPEVARSVWICGTNGYTGTQHVLAGMCK